MTNESFGPDYTPFSLHVLGNQHCIPAQKLFGTINDSFQSCIMARITTLGTR
jgi:hypothetical protein